MKRYSVDGTEVEADIFRVIDGALVLVKRDPNIPVWEVPVRAFGVGQWKSIEELSDAELTVPVVSPPVPHVAPEPKGEPSVPTKKLWQWVNKVRENTASGSFTYDADLISMIQEAEGGRKYEEPEPRPTPVQPERGKLD
jgi:hypothetical protein